MADITDHLKDPSWWFSVFFAGILASLFASYARDAISYVAAGTSTWAKSRRDKRLAKEREYVRLLVASPSFLIMEMIRNAVILIAFLAMSAIGLGLMALAELSGSPMSGIRVADLVLALLVAIVAGYVGAQGSRHVNLARRQFGSRVRSKVIALTATPHDESTI